MESRHLARMILERCDQIPDHPAMRWKVDGRWETLTYGEMLDRILRVSLKLKEMGVSKGDRVAIFSENRPEWAMATAA